MAASPWRFRWLLAAPHRIAFAAAAMLAVSGVWWAAVMVARSRGIGLPWALPPSTAHGLVMSFGFMPFFFTGFLFTAGPKWLRVPAVAVRELAAPLLAQLVGWAWFMLATHVPDAAFGAVFGGRAWLRSPTAGAGSAGALSGCGAPAALPIAATPS